MLRQMREECNISTGVPREQRRGARHSRSSRMQTVVMTPPQPVAPTCADSSPGPASGPSAARLACRRDRMASSRSATRFAAASRSALNEQRSAAQHTTAQHVDHTCIFEYATQPFGHPPLRASASGNDCYGTCDSRLCRLERPCPLTNRPCPVTSTSSVAVPLTCIHVPWATHWQYRRERKDCMLTFCAPFPCSHPNPATHTGMHSKTRSPTTPPPPHLSRASASLASLSTASCLARSSCRCRSRSRSAARDASYSAFCSSRS